MEMETFGTTTFGGTTTTKTNKALCKFDKDGDLAFLPVNNLYIYINSKIIQIMEMEF